MTVHQNYKSPPARPLWQWIVFFGVSMIIGVLIGRFMLSPNKEMPSKQAAQNQNAAVMAVEAVHPTPITIKNRLPANGVVAAVETAEVGSQISGVAIERVLVEVGEFVKAGQVLATLDTRTFEQQLSSAEAELATAVAAQEKAAADLARTEPLLAIDAVSRQEVDAYHTALRQALANVTAAKAHVESARTNQQRGLITAPVSGIISAKNAQVGAVVSGTPLFSIIIDGTLEWQAAVPPADAANIHVGQTASVEIAGRQVTGEVTRLSPVTNDSRDITVHVRLPRDSGASAGMYQSGEFLFDAQRYNAIPLSALVSLDGYDYVWQLIPNIGDDGRTYHQVKRRQITIITQQDNQVAIDDLPQSDLIVATSASFLDDDDLVIVATINGQDVDHDQTSKAPKPALNPNHGNTR